MSGPVHNGEDGRLRLQAAGQDDLEVLSALLQDAIIPGEDMFHDQGGRRFYGGLIAVKKGLLC